MISEKLMSEVLELDCTPHKEENGLVWFEYEDENSWTNDYINIHQLAHKCKEWAYDNGLVEYSEHAIATPKDAVTLVYKLENGAMLQSIMVNKKDINNKFIEDCSWILAYKSTKERVIR